MTNETRRHNLKVWPEFFRAIADGTKPFELRKNDRDFHVGDELMLREFDPTRGTYSGKAYLRKVTFMVKGPKVEWGLLDGFVIMGFGAYVVDAPAAPARADEPVMIDPVKAKALVEEQLESTRRSQIITAEDLQKTVRADAVPPSPATERPGAETTAGVNGINDPAFAADPKCPHCHGQGFTMVTHDFQGNGHAYSKPMTCGCRMTRSGVTLTVSQAIQLPSSPERERAQETPDWVVCEWSGSKSAARFRIVADGGAGVTIAGGLTKEDAKRIVAAVNAEAEREAETRSQLLFGDLLSRTCDALKGQPPVGTLYSTHDLPDVAAALVERLKAAEQLNSHDWQCGCGHWNGANLAACALCTRPLAESRR